MPKRINSYSRLVRLVVCITSFSIFHLSLKHGVNPLRSSPIPYIAGLAIVFGYAVLKHGGVVTADWNYCLLGLGLLALLYSLYTPQIGLAPRPNRGIWWPILLLPGYVALQLIPLPGSLLRVLSPARAELLDALRAAVPDASNYASLSVIPSNTLAFLLRIMAYTVVFMLVREIGWRWERRIWAPAFPIVAVGALEAALGLMQYYLGPQGSSAHGTYVNRSHFAGLLEMALPFAVIYPAAIIRRSRSRGLPAGAAVIACVMLALATLIFLGILYSFSRMGFVASLCSLFVLGATALGAWLPARKKWAGLVFAAVLVVCGFVFLAPDPLVQRFPKIDTDKEVPLAGRALIWKDTMHLIKAYPVFGCGLGGYESAFEKFNFSMPTFGVDYAHNDYLQLLAELGVIGFVIIAALMLAIITLAARAAFRHSEFEGRCLGIACVSAMVAIFVHSIVDFNLYIPANALLLAWVSGIAAGLRFSSRPRPVWEALGVPAGAEVPG